MREVCRRNGFSIREKEDREVEFFSGKPYAVYIPSFGEDRFVDDFDSLHDAERFCDRENADNMSSDSRTGGGFGGLFG